MSRRFAIFGENRVNKQLKLLTFFVIFLVLAENTSFLDSSSGFSSNLTADSNTFTFGNTEVGTIFDQNDANAKSASNFVCSNNGQITDIYAYIARAYSTETGKAAMYADDSGQPGALIAQSTAATITTSYEWVDFKLPTPERVVLGVVYWLSICSDEPLNIVIVLNSGARAHNENPYVEGFSDPFGIAWNTDLAGAMSVYASCNLDNSELSVSISPVSADIVLGGYQQFTSTVTGGIPPYSYQWYQNDIAILGAVSEDWIFTPTSVGNYRIYLNVTDALNIYAQSDIEATIAVYPQLSVSITPVSLNTTIGTPQLFNSIVIGGVQPYTYQWYLNGDSVAGAISNSWTFIPASKGAYNIFVNVTDINNVTIQSNSATVIVETPTNVTINPSQVKMYLGQSQTFISTVSGGTPTYSYQWCLNESAQADGINQNWTFTPTTAGHYKIYLNVTDALNIKVQSNIVTDITVYLELTASINPTFVNMTVGMQQTFNSTVSGGAQPYIYQWYLNGNPVLNANSRSWTFTPTTPENFTIYLTVTDSNTQHAQSNNATVRMKSTLVITGFTLVSGGSGYTTPAIILSGGGGTGATATARVSNGVIIAIVLTNPGNGYTSAPTVTIRDPSPRAKGAIATAILATV